MRKEKSDNKIKKQSLFLNWLMSCLLFYGTITIGIFYLFHWKPYKEFLHTDLLNQAKLTIQNYSPLISSALQKKDDISLMNYLDSIKKNPQVSHIKVISPEGIILCHNNVQLWNKHDTSNETKNILVSTITLIQKNVEGYNYSELIFDSTGNKIGYISIGLLTEKINNELDSKKRQILFIVLTLLFIYMLFNFFLYKRFIKSPLQNITNVLNSFLLGKSTDKIKIDKINDYTEISLAVNKILDKLHKREKESVAAETSQITLQNVIKIVRSVAQDGVIILNNEDNVTFSDMKASELLKVEYPLPPTKRHILDITTNETIINTLKEAIKNLGSVLTVIVKELNLKATIVAIDNDDKNHIATIISLTKDNV